MTYGDFKDLTRRTASDKMLQHLVLLKIRNMEDINQHGLASMVYGIFDKKKF